MKKTNTIFVSGNTAESDEFIPLIADGDDNFQVELPEGNIIPILPLRNIVLFPGIVLPVSIGRKKSLRLIKDVYKKEGFLGAIAQKEINVEEPEIKDLHTTGTIAQILRILEMPDGSTTVILQGKKRFNIKDIVESNPYWKAQVELIDDRKPVKNDHEFKPLIEAIKDLASKVIKKSGNIAPENAFAIKNIENNTFLVNFICSNFNINVKEKQELLQIDDLKLRSYKLLEVLTEEYQLLEIKTSIQSKAKKGIDQQQREYYLQQQMKTIQDELGGSAQEQEIKELRAKASKKKWSDNVKEIVNKEIDKLERLGQHSSDYSVQSNYVQTLIDLPWNEYSKDNFNLKRAQKVLDREHFGMEKVKERILEHLAVLKLKGKMKSPIICLYGPPGVGKTSLGKSIAESLGRKYVRVSLGGLNDEAEIRGHRRTYIGAMPGRIIDGIKKAGTSNPVFILDEIDKVGSDSFKGDPSSALLEVLDPEQNVAFHDNYIDIDYDLSNVMFVATANDLNTISRPLLDRMELIDISGYILEEKMEIAKKFLIPKQMENHGIAHLAKEIKFPNSTIEKIIDSYTRESGVRQLDKQIAKIMRKLAYKLALEEELPKEISPKDLKDLLGTEVYNRDIYQGNEYPGVVTGLAWTPVGGEILFIETSLCHSKTPKLTLTGNLGDVMKESATLALEYIHAHAQDFGIDEKVFEETSIHLHVPEGATPKDGPSAGITMATSIASALTGKKVKKGLAMTGEITLRGKVLPVGGIKEKILAAKRSGITEIILCKDNEKDIKEINELYIKGLTFHYVDTVKDVLKIALV